MREARRNSQGSFAHEGTESCASLFFWVSYPKIRRTLDVLDLQERIVRGSLLLKFCAQGVTRESKFRKPSP